MVKKESHGWSHTKKIVKLTKMLSLDWLLLNRILSFSTFSTFDFLPNLVYQRHPAMVADWSKTLVLQILVTSVCLGLRFESRLG